ncbi:DUF421 domain-containing protein [Larkinella terrae]|uniref:DUF421 domain-containing protein n=2 Tax=Larkinella terrae TaxID=2025311 RepID=A0A7K0EIR5_9BACT|nr:DUF421 domain-containing protein [Larkinella terrae]
MGCRAFVVFFVALFFNRIAGKRAFGMHAPFDNVILLLLGAILSRAVVGASPFVSTLTACLVLVLLHRLLGWVSCRSHRLEALIKGEKIVLFRNGTWLHQNMRREYITEEDLLEEVRIKANIDAVTTIKEAHLERNGQISVIKQTDSHPSWLKLAIV